MEKKDLDLETKRLKTAQRRENENETEKKLRQESDRQRIAKKRQLIADLNLETKRLNLETFLEECFFSHNYSFICNYYGRGCTESGPLRCNK